MKRIILCLSLFAFFGSQAQQINPVPDYVFRNQMSVGRNAVTDTAAYISIGPRYGANKGLMPPIVSDTAAITGVKRNGLLIFSVQRNNFQYWDSINSRWTSITANVDTTIISTRAWRKKGDDSLGSVIATRTDTTLLSTRAWRQKGLDSLAAIEIDGSGTVNRVPKFTATRTLGDGSIVDLSTSERLRIFANGRVGVNTTTDAGYQFDVAGSIRNTTGAAFATSSGNVGIGTSSPTFKLDINSGTSISTLRTINTSTTANRVFFEATSGNVEQHFLYTANQDWVIGLDKSDASKFKISSADDLFASARLTITTAGNVGIGTTSPSEVLHVVGRGRFTTIDSTSSPINVLTSDVNGVIRKTAPGVLGSGTTNYLPKFTGTTTIGNSVAFDNGTEILINTTSDAGDYRLQVNGNANFRDDVLIDSNARVNQHITLNATPKAWALGNAIQGPDAGRIFMTSGELQLFANVYYDGSYKYLANERAGAIFLLKNSINFVNYDSSGANTSLTGAKDMKFTNGELQIGLADQGTFKLQVADKSYFGDEVQIASTTDLGNYKLQVTGEAIITAGIRTDAPSGGTAATWKLGTVATVSPTSPNRTIEVEIGGTTYYIHAKTTND